MSVNCSTCAISCKPCVRAGSTLAALPLSARRTDSRSQINWTDSLPGYVGLNPSKQQNDLADDSPSVDGGCRAYPLSRKAGLDPRMRQHLAIDHELGDAPR